MNRGGSGECNGSTPSTGGLVGMSCREFSNYIHTIHMHTCILQCIQYIRTLGKGGSGELSMLDSVDEVYCVRPWP